MKADINDIKKEIDYRLDLLVNALKVLKGAASENRITESRKPIDSAIDILENREEKKSDISYSDRDNDPEVKTIRMSDFEIGFQKGELYSINRVIEMLVNERGYGAECDVIRAIKSLKDEL